MTTLDELVIERNDTHCRVSVERWADAAVAAHADGFTFFGFLSGMDWLPNPTLDGEHHYDRDRKETEPPEIVTDAAVRLAGGESRFSVMAHVENVVTHQELTLTADLDVTLHVPSWTATYKGAIWHERETWEMFGFIFDGHPGLRHIYLPEEFVGHPLRKDFALPARLVRPWPGLVDMEEMPKDPEPEEAS